MSDWCDDNAASDPLAADCLRTWLWAVAGIVITKPQNLVHKGQVYYRCYRHLSEASGMRHVMDVPLVAEAERMMFSPAAPAAAMMALTSSLGNQAVLFQPNCQDKHIQMLRDILAPGASSALTRLASMSAT